MSIKKRWVRFVAGFMLERPGHKRTFDQWASQLLASGEKITERLAGADDSPSNGACLRHIIGIERWGQSRLRVALGEPFKEDESDDYYPAENLDWAALQSEWTSARQDTVALAHQLAGAPVNLSLTILHNQFGPLSAYAWLRYLEVHARLTGRALKAASQ
jgi:hypothetical protein